LVSKTITHKSDVGGVALNQTPESIGQTLTDMRSTLKVQGVIDIEGFLVQQQFNADVELIIGAKHDPLGTVILVGTGGRLAELLQDTAMTVLPPGHALTAEAAKALLQRIRMWQLLHGYRGKPALDIDAVIGTLVTFSEMIATLNGRFDQAEINPLLVFEQGQGVIAVDAVMNLHSH
jgi:succinyl-CoA synthetase beta subunit